MDAVELGLISRTFYYVPVWAAQRKGFFADHGLDVRTSLIGAAAQTERLRDGSLHISIAPPEGILHDVQLGGSLRMIAGNSGKLSHHLMARPEIRRIEDMRGRRFGILTRQEGSFFHFQEMAEAHGLAFPGDYEVVETGGAPLRHRALLEGTIDAGLQSIPWNYAAEELGFNNLGSITDYIPQWQFNTVNVDSAWASAHRERVVRFLKALHRGVEWTYGHPAEASAIAAAELPVSLAHARRAWDYFTLRGKLTRDLALTTPGLQKVIQIQKKAGLLPESASLDPAVYADLSYLGEAIPS